ncbi:MAG: hypothetical protein Q4Q53_06800 [Methanocorpusculum sp.]|nr:hypothetical protein [Methanocorpusculum sp.]
MKKDDGVTEVVGFAFVLIIAIFAVMMWVLVALPMYGTNDELQHNTAVEFEIADLKKDIDTMCLSNATDVKRMKIINLAPTSDKSKMTVIPDLKTLMSFGTISVGKNTSAEFKNSNGDKYYSLRIVYSTSNMYAPDITIIYDGGNLTTDVAGVKYTPLAAVSEYKVVVPEDFENSTKGSNEAAVIEYFVEKIDGDYCVMSVWIGD